MQLTTTKVLAKTRLKEDLLLSNTHVSYKEDEEENNVERGELRVRDLRSWHGENCDDDRRIIPYLAARAYHIPGNGYYEDLVQYICNNHPVFGICLRHKLHPIGTGLRFLALFGSSVFGLATTSIIWLGLIYCGKDPNVIAVDVSLLIEYHDYQQLLADFAAKINYNNDFAIILLLLTFASGVHSCFDNTIWYLSACVCCLPGQCCEPMADFRIIGHYVAGFIICLVATFAIYVVLIRASVQNDESYLDLQSLKSVGLYDDEINLLDLTTYSEGFDFMLTYVLELFFALFVLDPITKFIFFSGIMGCGKMPILGGRPYEIKVEQNAKAAESDEISTTFENWWIIETDIKQVI